MSTHAPADARPVKNNPLLLYAGFSLSIVFTSLVIAEKPGPLFLLAYLLVTLPLLYLLCLRIFPRLAPAHDRTTYDRAAITALVAAFILMSIAYFVIHPQIDTSGFRLFGARFGASDADDAIDQALGELFAGRYPYYAVTFTNNPITPMPGALLLALPFYLLGNSAFQNIAWLGVFALVAARRTGSYTAGAALLFTMLAFAPNLVFHLIQGTDYLANNIYILVFTLLLIDSVEDSVEYGHGERGHSQRRRIVSAALLGIGLAARLNYLLLLPLLYAYLARRAGFRQATYLLAISLAVFAALIAPFYLYDPAGFSPLHTTSLSGGVLAYPVVVAGIVTLLLTRSILIAPALSWSYLIQSFFWAQFTLIALSLLRVSLELGRFVDNFARFGLLAICFGVLGFGVGLCRLTAAPTTAATPAAAPVMEQARR